MAELFSAGDILDEKELPAIRKMLKRAKDVNKVSFVSTGGDDMPYFIMYERETSAMPFAKMRLDHLLHYVTNYMDNIEKYKR